MAKLEDGSAFLDFIDSFAISASQIDVVGVDGHRLVEGFGVSTEIDGDHEPFRRLVLCLGVADTGVLAQLLECAQYAYQWFIAVHGAAGDHRQDFFGVGCADQLDPFGGGERAIPFERELLFGALVKFVLGYFVVFFGCDAEVIENIHVVADGHGHLALSWPWRTR